MGSNMKIALHSDLHLEMHGTPSSGFLTDKEFDVLVLAGDIVTHGCSRRLWQLSPHVVGKPVIYIPGNHEFYGGDYLSTSKELESVCEQYGIEYANRKVVMIDDTAFVCAVGWADLESFGEFTSEQKKCSCSGISDFFCITKHTVEDMISLSAGDKKFITTAIESLTKEGWKGKIVVVTHFSPMEMFRNYEFDVSPIASYFCNNWEELLDGRIDMWLYGHTHQGMKGLIGSTIVASNQRGYYWNGEPSYDENYILEI